MFATTKGDLVKFSRGGSSGRHDAENQRRSRPQDALDEPGALDHSAGPYDSVDAPPGVARLDFGSIAVPAIEGVEIRLQDNGTGHVDQIILADGASALSVVAVAAPKTEGIWDEVRDDLRKTLSADGIAAEDIEGPWGPALRAVAGTPDGPVDLCFVGIDGPRWMIRGVFQGPAALDPATGPLAVALDGIVVNRGRDAMPAMELLPLSIPKEYLEAMRAAATDAKAPTSADGLGDDADSGSDQTPAQRRVSPRPRRSE